MSTDEAALVFRRAAELEAAREAASPDAALDLAAVAEAGRDAGLAPEAVREAVAEVRARGIPGSEGAAVAATDAVAARTVDGSARTVARAIVDFLEGELLVPAQDLGDRAVWLPERGIEARLERKLDDIDLRPVERLIAAVVPVPGEDRTHVRFEADVAGPSAGVRAGVPAVVGVAGGAVLAAVEPAAGAGLAVVGLAVAGVGWRSARVAHEKAAAQVSQALEAFLTWLARR